ncbi:hypothetical protein ACXYUI_33950, partial [Klebsiella pneumoniae]
GDPINSSLWNSFSVAVSAAGGSSFTQAFQPLLPVALAGPDGLYSFSVQATDTANAVASNKKDVLYILDTVAP